MNLIFRNITFDKQEMIEELLTNLNIENVPFYSCHFHIKGIELFVEPLFYDNIVRFEMYNCSFESKPDEDSADIEMANYLTGMSSLTRALVQKCGLSGKATKILYSITERGNKIVFIENE